ncbi:hypothetical protein COC42_02295 [Sphingomonas spermidinifaciens]|uniref:Uncharacterized protein n=1 Tax=Sphingomonas spermidinifaciens TaxID=1141889 RepID=A0A2A4B492_9SPHN|nr:hypothetical protein [Sphingomonas spermidinifaciens]PCD03261.1 hypothetical protein COC42_02295 [Sphingomonas spermidinifaciens]
MRTLLVLVGLVALVLVVLMSLGMVSIDQTRPAVVQAPEFKADVGKVELGTTNRTVEVPTLQVEKADGAKQ